MAAGPSQGRLAGHTAIVTGAASGIGRAIAIRFAAEGAFVLGCDLGREPRGGGPATDDVIRAGGGAGELVIADVSRWEDVAGLVARVADAHGRLDIMVNNAAIGEGGRLTETSEEVYDRVMAVNLKGVFLGCKAAALQMLGQEPREHAGQREVRGRIVNISSQHGMISSPGHLAYGVSKAGVVYMTRQIAADYARDGIVCNAVAPGKILTDMGGFVPTEAQLAYSRSRTPWPRLGLADDVASAVLFLASPEATYITGENLMVDGGWMAS
ncbi:MAG: SDR family oxidoreductase [Rhizobiales bacterium]|nr:SDR family oxidoreductase [Hyphomicrobiales bacterium]